MIAPIAQMSDLIEIFISKKCYSGGAKLGLKPTILTVEFVRIKLSPKSHISIMGSLLKKKGNF